MKENSLKSRARKKSGESARLSKFLCYVLRHHPEEIGVEVDGAGWVEVAALIEKVNAHGRYSLEKEALAEIVSTDKKGRYSMRGGRIRCNQGHSIDVQAVELVPRSPPSVLYHGTTMKRWELMQRSGGIERMRRHHVHLSHDLKTAKSVGSRHREGGLVIVKVDSEAMVKAGHLFYCSENQVWLVDFVPLEFLSLVD